MRRHTCLTMRNVLTSTALLTAAATLVLWSSVAAAPISGAPAAAPKWLTWNASTHTASLTLIANYTGAVNGYNFNGYGNGKMVVSVPVGATVKVTFKNKSAAMTHSAVITAYADRNSASSPSPAFSGASTPNPMIGTASGVTEHFSFVANKVGRYAIVCAVPGHDVNGMWDVFRVTKGGSAKITFK